ncbi:MAG: hypothetical protein SCH71_16935 [Desulfobulbaceae bacterium]|nr:hypothetical protein [Desulfobulbaceae bacterium]
MDELQKKIDEFQKHVPMTDVTLLILKSHLIIEARLLEFIKERVCDKIYKEISEQREWTYHIRIFLAHALSDRDEIPSANSHIIWPALRMLGKLRNQIAHDLEHKEHSLENKMREFIKIVDYEGKRIGAKVTKENLLRVFWYATILLHSYLTIDRVPSRFCDENL